MPLKVLIVGAGICGPAAATMLRRMDPLNDITIVELYPSVRADGQQIDLRSWGVPIAHKLGVFDAIKAKCVHEDGIAFVDSEGKVRAVFGVGSSGDGAQSFTSEFEIMRGDLAQVFYDESLRVPVAGDETGTGTGTGTAPTQGERGDDEGPGVRYRFSLTLKAMTQDADGVDVTFSDGSTGRYDLVLGADGQWSRTRRLMFGEEAGLGMFHRLNVHVAYFTVPRHADETDELARAFQPGGGRAVMSRTGSRPETQAYLMLRTDSEEVRKAVERQPAETQKALFEERFRGAGWKADQFLDAMRDTKDFYADSIGQVKAPTMVQGRVALLGDAGCCASPVTGMGTTVSLITAYVLAGELARNKGNVPLALEAYNVNVKPYIDEAQKLMPGVPQLMTLKSRWAVALFYAVIRIVSLLRIDRLVASVTGEDKGGLTVPEYPELKFAPVA